MDANSIQNKSEGLTPQSATTYQEVDVSEDDFLTPDKPFKGVHIGGAGDLVITGIDDVTVTLAVTPGCWPYAGIAITTDTTATGIVALF